jgi:pimeloyl-ACP methyl ester carboxylesterase
VKLHGTNTLVWLRVTALAVSAALLASCGDGSGDGVAPLPIFDGTGDFYDVPDPLPAAEPGELIRVQPVTLGGHEDRGAMRVMYHTRDSHHRDVAATGVVTYPLSTPPDGGWPVLSYGHGTSGLAPQCAPSRGTGGPPAFGVEGVVVAADYPGLGPNGQRHAYLSGASEGHAVIDLVRAARRIPDAAAGARWAAAGVSQGGHAVLFADELAASYAPELELVGTVAIAPGSSLGETFPGDTPLVIGAVSAMALFGIAEEYAEIIPEDYASPALLAASSVLDTGCINDISLAFAAIPFDQMFINDPRTTEPARSVMFENDPGRRATSAPILVVQGDADAVVVPARTESLFAKLCAIGAVVDLQIIPGAGHDDVARRAATVLSAPWLAARFAGEPAPSGCAPAS